MSVTGEVEFLCPNLRFRLEENWEDKALVTVFENTIPLTGSYWFTCVAVGSWCSRDTLDWKCVDNTVEENKDCFEFYCFIQTTM